MIFVEKLRMNDTLIVMAGIFLASLLCIYVPIKVMRQAKMCNWLVTARCVRYNRYYSAKASDSYAPVFQYTYGGISYERQTLIPYSLKKIQNLYVIGQNYQIYINADCPEMCTDKKKTPAIYIVMILIGVGMLAMSLLLLGYGLECR